MSLLYILQNIELFWNDHEALCSFRYDTHLASIHNNSQNINAQQLCQSLNLIKNCYIGLNNIHPTIWEWTDGTIWDWGTNISGGIYPWSSLFIPYGQPESPDSNGHCVVIWDIDHNWMNNWCDTNEWYGLCNYPSPITIISDKLSYQRMPSSGNIIGMIDILDEIYITFDFILHSFSHNNQFESILRFGNNKNESYPSIFTDSLSEKIIVEFVCVSTNNLYFELSVSLLTLYQFEFLITQNRAIFSINQSTIYDNYIDSHSVIMDRNLYIGDNIYNTANVTMYGLMVTTSNTHQFTNGNSESFFNYLCDYNNRFSNNGYGNWVFNSSTCEVSQTDATNFVSIIWLGDKDMLSKQWTNYKIESIFNIKSGTAVLVLLRAQSIGFFDDGYQIGIGLIATPTGQKVRMQRIENGGWVEIKSVPATVNYNVDYILRIDVNGNNFTVYLNHKWIFQAEDSTLTFGSVGLRTYEASVIFKSLRITFPTDSSLITAEPSITPTTSIPTNYPSTLPSISPTTSIPTINPSFRPTLNPTRDGGIQAETSTLLIDLTQSNDKKSDAEDKTIWIYIIIILLIVIATLCIFAFVFIKYIKKKKLNVINNQFQHGNNNHISVKDTHILSKIQSVSSTSAKDISGKYVNDNDSGLVEMNSMHAGGEFYGNNDIIINGEDNHVTPNDDAEILNQVNSMAITAGNDEEGNNNLKGTENIESTQHDMMDDEFIIGDETAS